VEVAREAEVARTEVVPDFAVLGPRRGKDAQRIGELVRAGHYELVDGRVQVDGTVLAEDEVRLRTVAAPGFEVASTDGVVVALDTDVTPKLELEGRARDLIRQIQQERKRLDLPVTARIEVVYPEADAQVVAAHGDDIAEETLAVALRPGEQLSVRPTGDTSP
jgi:isoleucyl-tRNA synthetase